MYRAFGEYQLIESRATLEPFVAYYLAATGDPPREIELRVCSSLLKDAGADPGRMEARLHQLRDLTHPHLVRIAYAGVRDDAAFYVTDVAESLAFEDYLASRNGRLPALEALDTLVPLGHALAYLHQNGVVHGNVSPRSIRVDPASERVYLGTLDLWNALGLARTLESLRRGGAGALLTPELAKAWPLDPRTDVFLFGAVLYQTLTGRPPPTMAGSAGRDPATLLNFQPPSTLARLPESLDEVLLAALAFRPGDRPAGIGPLLESLEGLRPELELAARPGVASGPKAIQEEALARKQEQVAERKERRKASRRETDRRQQAIEANPLNALGYWFLDQPALVKLVLFALMVGGSSQLGFLDPPQDPLESGEYATARVAVASKKFDRQRIEENLAERAAEAMGIPSTPENYEERMRSLRRFAKALPGPKRAQLYSPQIAADLRITYARDAQAGCAMLDQLLRRASVLLEGGELPPGAPDSPTAPASLAPTPPAPAPAPGG